jgi:hypothetical protein
VVLRLYWPKEEALEGKWIAPPMKRLQYLGTLITGCSGRRWRAAAESKR